MTFNKGNLAFVLLAWAFFVGLIGFGAIIPLVLMIVATILYLIV